MKLEEGSCSWSLLAVSAWSVTVRVMDGQVVCSWSESAESCSWSSHYSLCRPGHCSLCRPGRRSFHGSSCSWSLLAVSAWSVTVRFIDQAAAGHCTLCRPGHRSFHGSSCSWSLLAVSAWSVTVRFEHTHALAYAHARTHKHTLKLTYKRAATHKP